MANFDAGRACRMVAVAVLVAWVALLIGTTIDVFDLDRMSGEMWRFRLSSIAGLASPSIMLWLAVSLALMLSLAEPSRDLVIVYGAIAVATTLLGLAEIFNLATAGDQAMPYAREVARIAAMTGGLVLSVTILAIVRDRLRAFDEQEIEDAAEEDSAYSSPEENR